MTKTSTSRAPKKEITFDDLDIDEAIDLLQQIKSNKDVMRGLGDSAFAGKPQVWRFHISAAEMA